MATSKASKPKTKDRKILDSAGKTILWWFGNVVFGLAPVLLVILITSLPLNLEANNSSNHELDHLLKDGTVNFFCLAIMGSITVDIMLARHQFSGNFPVVMLVLAILTTLFIAIVYMAFIIGGDEEHTFGSVKWLTIVLSIFSFCFCTIGKINLFLKEVK